MTERETLLLQEFKEKIEKLIGFHQKIKSENKLLLDQQQQLKEQNALLNSKNEELNKKIDEIKFAKTMANSDTDTHQAKIKINRLVKEIDNCIALLNK